MIKYDMIKFSVNSFEAFKKKNMVLTPQCSTSASAHVTA